MGEIRGLQGEKMQVICEEPRTCIIPKKKALPLLLGCDTNAHHEVWEAAKLIEEVPFCIYS